MRALAGLVLILAPLAAAQAPVDLATLTIDPFPEPARPLQGPVSGTIHLRASCTLAEPVVGVPVSYVVTQAPAWATVLVSPATEGVDPTRCDAGWIETNATLIATVSDQAPAFTPMPIVVQAVVGSGAREQRPEATVGIDATYFAVLDVQAPETQVVIPPGGSHDFVVKVANFGNGETRVETTIASAGEGLQVAPPAPITLESKQAGGTRIASDVTISVRADDVGGFVNRVGVINARLLATALDGPAEPFDAATISFLVTVRTGASDADESGRGVPGPSAIAALVTLALVALSAARSSAARRRRAPSGARARSPRRRR